MPEERTTQTIRGVADQPLERQFQALLTRAARDGLMQKVPGLNRLLQDVPSWPSKLRDQNMTRALNAVATYEQSLTENPYHAAPPERINGPVTVGQQKRDGTPIGIEPIELCGNIAVIGSTGSGKTAFLEHLLTSLDVASPDTQQCFYDPKGDWIARAARHQDTIIVDEELPLALLIPPDFMTREEYHALLVRTFCDAYYGGFHMHHILNEAIREAFAAYPNGPSMRQLLDAIQHLGGKDRTYQFRDAQLNAGTRIQDLCTVFPGISTAAPPRCHTLQTLLTRPAHFASTGRLHAYEFLFTLWVQVRHAYHQASGIKDGLHTIIIADESLQLFDANARHITGEPLLTHTIGMTREAGMAWGLTLSSWCSVSPVLRANINLQAALRVTDGRESEELRRTLRLTPAQHEYLDHRLRRGEVILRLGHRHPEPMLATYPPPLAGAKDITPEERTAARARAEQLLPPAPPVTITTPAVPMPAFRLNETQHRVLRDILTGPLRPTTVIYNDNDVPFQVGDRTKAYLFTTGLITSTPVTIHGRRGGRANILSGTKAGYALLGITPPPRSRGGGIPHSYYCQELARHIPTAHQEVALNTDGGVKCADVTFRYDEAKHDWLPRFLAASASTPDGDEPTLKEGHLVAIEVEISDPATSSVNNATKDLNAGIDLIIIAIQPADRETVTTALQQHVPNDLWHRIGITPILTLLDTSRPTEGTP